MPAATPPIGGGWALVFLLSIVTVLIIGILRAGVWTAAVVWGIAACVWAIVLFLRP